MKHHYIPVFYLKHWRGPDGQVCVYSPDRNGRVNAFRKFPDGTGYVPDLYALPDRRDVQRQSVETHFFSPADSYAADAMRHLIQNSNVPMTPTQRSAWSRYLMSLMLRDPASIATMNRLVEAYVKKPSRAMEEEYNRTKGIKDPETLREWIDINIDRMQSAAISMLPRLVDNVDLGTRLNGMKWGVITIGPAGHPLLTSDHPLVTTATLDRVDSYIAIPLSERKFFVAHNEPEIYQRLVQASPTALSQSVNKTVVAAATKYVWGRTDAALNFVRSNFSTLSLPNLFERIIAAKQQQ